MRPLAVTLSIRIPIAGGPLSDRRQLRWFGPPKFEGRPSKPNSRPGFFRDDGACRTAAIPSPLAPARGSWPGRWSLPHGGASRPVLVPTRGPRSGQRGCALWRDSQPPLQARARTHSPRKWDAMRPPSRPSAIQSSLRAPPMAPLARIATSQGARHRKTIGYVVTPDRDR